MSPQKASPIGSSVTNCRRRAVNSIIVGHLEIPIELKMQAGWPPTLPPAITLTGMCRISVAENRSQELPGKERSQPGALAACLQV